MVEDNKISKIVEGLDIGEVRELATRQLGLLENKLLGKIDLILDLKRASERYPGISISMDGYNSVKAEMQRYGLWEERYDEVLQKAKKTGKVDVGFFYGHNK
jgi:hypothetical protein